MLIANCDSIYLVTMSSYFYLFIFSVVHQLSLSATQAEFNDVTESETEQISPNIRWCVTSYDAFTKCNDLKASAIRDKIVPGYDCVSQLSVDKCMQGIRNGDADIITVDASDALRASKLYNLKPIVAEKYYKNSTELYAVAVIKKNSIYESFKDLRGSRSCHTSYLKTAGWVAPLLFLLRNNLIKKDDCPYTKAVSNYFARSCILGIPEEASENGKLTNVCGKTGYQSPLKCLMSGNGDVAFTKHVKVLKAIDDGDINENDVELLCPDEKRAHPEQYESCNYGMVPPHVIITSNEKSADETNYIKKGLIKISDYYTLFPELFHLFGKYNGKEDLLFLSPATGVTSLDRVPAEVNNNFANGLNEINLCDLQNSW